MNVRGDVVLFDVSLFGLDNSGKNWSKLMTYMY